MTPEPNTILDEMMKAWNAARNAAGASVERPYNKKTVERATEVIAKTIADAVMAERKRGHWQPIETAPANTAILLHIPHLDYYGNNGVYAGMLVNMGTGARWMTFGHAIGRDLGPECKPDAWRPFPSPPKEEGE